MFCQKCGNEIPDNSVFVMCVGRKFPPTKKHRKAPRKKEATPLLCCLSFL